MAGHSGRCYLTADDRLDSTPMSDTSPVTTEHASSPETDVVTTLRRCYVNYTGSLFDGEWSSNSPVWCIRHCAVKCLSTWLMTSISSPKATDDPFGLPLITCARCHVRTTAFETEALALSAREFGTVCHVACGHLTSATNILKRY